MLRTDKPIYKIILVFNLLLIVAAVVLSVMSIGGEGATITRILSAISRLIALLFAGFYIVLGYRKDAAKYYKLFGVLYLISISFGIIACVNNTSSSIDIVCFALAVLCILALTFVKNLGKNKSFAICGVLVALHIVMIILSASEGDPTVVMINLFMGVDLACLFGIMTYAKYLDKAERGTE